MGKGQGAREDGDRDGYGVDLLRRMRMRRSVGNVALGCLLWGCMCISVGCLLWMGLRWWVAVPTGLVAGFFLAAGIAWLDKKTDRKT